MLDSMTDKHPAFGLISVARVSGTANLVGSPLAQHHQSFRLRVTLAERYVDDVGIERYMGRASGTIVDVEMSPAQFVELMSSMNCSEGVPCTIRRLRDGDLQQVDLPPLESSGPERLRDHVAGKLQEIGARATRAVKEMEVLASGKLLQADRRRMVEIVRGLAKDVVDELPYIGQIFDEVTEQALSALRAERDSMVTSTVQRLGIQAASARPMIGPGPDTDTIDG